MANLFRDIFFFSKKTKDVCNERDKGWSYRGWEEVNTCFIVNYLQEHAKYACFSNRHVVVIVVETIRYYGTRY